MTNQVKDMFAEITMPEESVQKIRAAMAEKALGKPRKKAAPRPATAAAVLSVLLLAGLACNTQVRAAVDEFLKRYVFNNGNTVITISEDGMCAVSHTPSMQLYLRTEEDGRLYLLVNGEHIDITDQTSMEKPYIYTYVDEDDVEHLLIAGGTPENHGIHEFYREIGGTWLGGYGENYLDMETQTAYPWLAAAWEELNLPWPMPGESG